MTTLTKSANQHLHRPTDRSTAQYMHGFAILCFVSKWWSKTKYNKQQRRRRRRKRQLAKTTVKTFTKKKKRRKKHSEHLKRCAIVWILRDHFGGVHTNWLYSVTKCLSSETKRRYNGRWFTHSFTNFDYWNSTAAHFSEKFPIGISWLQAEKRQLHLFISFISFSLSLFAVDANCLTHQLFNKHFGAVNEWINESTGLCVLGVDVARSWCVKNFTFVTWLRFPFNLNKMFCTDYVILELCFYPD